jgi:dihydrofolate synthase/folylpolyglutamate synthase
MRSTDPVDAWLQGQAGLNPREIELGLDRVRKVWQGLGSLRPAPRLITVGGTNGKGSCAALLEAILRAAGYRVGCYTSPHLVRYAERVRVDGAPVEDARLLAALQRVAAVRAGTPLTYFELGTLAAFEIFAAAGLDVAVLEVGLGGRLDAVNVVDPDAALVMTVALDHQDWLGADRESIGREKAAIFRTGLPAVCGDGDPPRSLLAHARGIGADLWLRGRDFTFERTAECWDWRGRHAQRRSLPLPILRGPHQLDNAAAVLATLESVAAALPVDQRAVREGLLSVRLGGRFEVRRIDQVEWVLDVAHNTQAAGALRANLAVQRVPGQTLAVLAMLAGKDVAGVASALQGAVDFWHLASLDDPRGLPGDRLAAGLRDSVSAARLALHPDVPAALQAAAAAARPGDRILVFGSFVTVGEALRWLADPAPRQSL